jgi:integrase
MTAITRLDSQDNRRKAILSIKDSYSADVKHFVRFLDSRNLDLNLEGLLVYSEHLNGSPAGTKNKRLCAAKNRIRYLFYRSPDALDTAKSFRFEQALHDIKGKKKASRSIDRESLPTMEEIKQLIRKLREHGGDKRNHSARLPLIIEFLAVTGCRVSEMTGIRLADVREKGDYVEIRLLGKGNKERSVAVASCVAKRIRDVFRGEKYLFETGGGKPYRREYVSNQIKKAGRRILGRDMSAHTLRHVFATTALKSGWSPKKIAVQLGHSSTSITLDMYCQDSPTWMDVKRLFETD